MSLRKRELEAAWSAWQAGVRLGEGQLTLMRRIIDAVDAERARDARKDKDEATNQS